MTATEASFPHRKPLSFQVALYLRSRIAERAWRDALPSERQLAELCKVSRTVIRAALEILQREETVELRPSRPARIVTVPPEAGGAQQRVAHFINPVALENTTLENAIQIDTLREILYRHETHLELIADRRVDWTRPQRFLERTVTKTRSVCWVLNSPNRAVQDWFQKRGIPAVISGTPHRDIRLPYVDNDWGSVGAHAAGLFTRGGHRRIALLLVKGDCSGDLILKHRFLETAGRLAPETEVTVKEHAGEPAEAARAVRELIRGPRPPTALFASHTNNALSAVSCLFQEGLRLPRDVSLVFRVHSIVLENVISSPTCYKLDVHGMAKAVAGLVRIISEGGEASAKSAVFVPRFEKGSTFAAYREQASPATGACREPRGP